MVGLRLKLTSFVVEFGVASRQIWRQSLLALPVIRFRCRRHLTSHRRRHWRRVAVYSDVDRRRFGVNSRRNWCCMSSVSLSFAVDFTSCSPLMLPAFSPLMCRDAVDFRVGLLLILTSAVVVFGVASDFASKVADLPMFHRRMYSQLVTDINVAFDVAEMSSWVSDCG